MHEVVHGRRSGSLKATTDGNTHLQSNSEHVYVLVCCTETFDVSTFDTPCTYLCRPLTR